MSIVCLEQDRGITGCTYSMQSAIYIMYNTHFINIYFITTYCNCMEYFTLLIKITSWSVRVTSRIDAKKG